MLIKILIVDDDIDIVSMLGKTFTTLLQGYLVLTATSANEGLGMMKEQRPDVIVLDVRLGPQSGMDLLADFTEYLRSHGKGYQPRFIVMTAYPDENVKRQALEVYKTDAFLMKPFDLATIRRAVGSSVRRVLEREMETLRFLDSGGPGRELEREARNRKLDEELKNNPKRRKP